MDEATIDKLAEQYLAWLGAVEAELKKLSHDQLLALSKSMETHHSDFHRRIDELAQSEMGHRYAIFRARALNAASYCMAHDCDAKDCPAGAHE